MARWFKKVLSGILLFFSLSSCSSLPTIVPVDARVGKTNIDNKVAKQSNQLGDSQSSNFTYNTASSMIASFFAGGLLVMISSIGFVYIIIKQRKPDG